MGRRVGTVLLTAAMAMLWAAFADAGGPAVLHLKDGRRIAVDDYTESFYYITYRQGGRTVRVDWLAVDRIVEAPPAQTPVEQEETQRWLENRRRLYQQEGGQEALPPIPWCVEGSARYNWEKCVAAEQVEREIRRGLGQGGRGR